MQRRKFLGTLGLGLGATALPVWLSRSFGLELEHCPEVAPPGPPPPSPPPPPPPLRCDPPASGGVARPQLVLVIPTDSEQQYSRGHAFGELINHGSDEQLARLAAFDVVCRRTDELPEALRLAREPLMFVIEAGEATVLDAELPPPLRDANRWGESEEGGSFEVRADRRIQERIDLLAGLIDGALTRDRLGAQAVRELAALPCERRELIFHRPESIDELEPEELEKVAASALLAALDRPPIDRLRLIAPLAAAARARLSASPVPGARWATGYGCGIQVEGEEPMAIGCGMGHVPARSTRFLMFFANPYE